MRWLKHPMSNAVYVALITAVYAAIFIVSSEFTTNYETLLSNSWWAYFIASKGIKFVGVGMIGIAIVIDILSALRRKKYDEYQVIVLHSTPHGNDTGIAYQWLFCGNIIPPFIVCTCFCTNIFCGNYFWFHSATMGCYSNYRNFLSD